MRGAVKQYYVNQTKKIPAPIISGGEGGHIIQSI